MNILIVDDEDDQRTTMQWLLEEWGFDIQTACNGAVALELARRRCPDVVLTDLNMPVMNGFEATRRMRALPGMAHTHVIAISGYLHDNQQWRDRAIAAGCNTCLGKPVDLKLLHAELLRVHAALLLEDVRRNGESGPGAGDLRWAFSSQVSNRWVWACYDSEGELVAESSGGFGSYAACKRDAKIGGYVPSTSHRCAHRGFAGERSAV